ncbi:hypothetical protein B566_EDAN017106, partial [Ephemera danica]
MCSYRGGATAAIDGATAAWATDLAPPRQSELERRLVTSSFLQRLVSEHARMVQGILIVTLFLVAALDRSFVDPAVLPPPQPGSPIASVAPPQATATRK